MASASRCPRCGGDVEIFFLRPGDKASRCKFCGHVEDLPDGETRTEVDEEEVRPDGTHIVRHVVTSHASAASPQVEIPMLQGFRQQFEQVARDNPDEADKIMRALHQLEQSPPPLFAMGGMVGMSVVQSTTSVSVQGRPKAATVRVAWSDGNEYPGTLQEERDGQCLIRFGDGIERWVPASAVRR